MRALVARPRPRENTVAELEGFMRG